MEVEIQLRTGKVKMADREIQRLSRNISSTCLNCVNVAETHEWARQNNMDLWGHRQVTPYLAEKASDGHPYGCDPNCPFLKLSMKTLS